MTFSKGVPCNRVSISRRFSDNGP